jgi:hypothetical protein
VDTAAYRLNDVATREIATQAALTRSIGVSQVRVTQVLRRLKWPAIEAVGAWQ